VPIDFWKSNHYMHSGKDGIDEFSDPIGGEKQDGLAILQLSQEHGDEAIALNILRRALFQVSVGFVKQEHGIPSTCKPKNVVEPTLQCGRIYTKLAS
jgi:hypothetical protein